MWGWDSLGSSDTGYHLPAECVKGSREEVLHIKHQCSSLQRQQERSQHLGPCFCQVIMFLITWASFGVPVCLSLWPTRHHLWVNGAQVYLPKQSFLSKTSSQVSCFHQHQHAPHGGSEHSPQAAFFLPFFSSFQFHPYLFATFPTCPKSLDFLFKFQTRISESLRHTHPLLGA